MSNKDPYKDLFSYFDLLFQKGEDFLTLPKSLHRKNAYMLNKFMAKGYPRQASMLNRSTIDGFSVAMLWYYSLRGRFTGKPKFMYVTGTKSKPKSEIFSKFSDAYVNYWVVKNECGISDFKLELEYCTDSEIKAMLEEDLSMFGDLNKIKTVSKNKQNEVLI
jgi:hypothetical protein